MKIPEVLAPVGDFESLKAAIFGGADAVYFGGIAFNARVNADNFDFDQMKMAIEFSHLYGVKVYITLNTLLFDNEFEDFLELVSAVYKFGADAVIVQDIGAISIIAKYFPDLHIHASTQMTVVNSSYVEFLEKMGIKRVVLGRELSLNEIKEIRANTRTEIEVFCHGALCVCYSGKCLMSSLIGGRSGNRGACAQPCRLPYKLFAKDKEKMIASGYLLSTKDVEALTILPQVIDSGVQCIKIEGRMKGPEYVYNVVRLYKQYISELTNNNPREYAVLEEDLKTLLLTFNRGGFSKGYLKGKSNKNLVYPVRPNNYGMLVGKITDIDSEKNRIKINLSSSLDRLDYIEIRGEHGNCMVKHLDSIFDSKNTKIEGGKEKEDIFVQLPELKRIKIGDSAFKVKSIKISNSIKTFPERKIQIRCLFKAKLDKEAELVLFDDINSFGVESQNKVTKAIKVQTGKERVQEALKKLGGTPFHLGELEVYLDDGVNIPISEINEMRRKAVDGLSKLREENAKRPQNVMYKSLFQKDEQKVEVLRKSKKVYIDIYNLQQFSRIVELEVDTVCYDYDAYVRDSRVTDISKACEDKGILLFLKFSHIFKQDNAHKIHQYVDSIYDLLKKGHKFCGIVFNDLGLFWNMKRRFGNKMKYIADYGVNVANSYTCRSLSEEGVDGAVLSVEMELGQINELERNLKDSEFMRIALVHGHIQFMISEYCVAGAFGGGCDKALRDKGECHEKYLLKDRTDKEIKYWTNSLCQSYLYNSDILYMGDRLKELMNSGVNSIRIDARFLSDEEAYKTAKVYIAGFKNGKDMASEDKPEKYTRGHYYRGV